MSTVKTNNVQIGQSVTATNNFTWYQPASPDGTVRLGNGNAGSVTDLITVGSTGNLTFANSISLSAASTKTLTLNGGAGSNGLVIDASNNVGIGAASPSNKLVVSNGGAAGIELGPVNGDIFTYNRSTSAYTDMILTAANITLRSNGGSNTLKLDSAGNLGLGVTPTDRMSILTTQGVNTFSNSLMTYGSGTAWPAGFANIYDANYVDQFLLLNSRMTGGTRASPTFTSQVAGIVLKVNGQTGGLAFLTIPAGSGQVGTQAMTLDASGNLIVGDTSTTAAAKAYVNCASGSNGWTTKVANNANVFFNGYYGATQNYYVAGTGVVYSTQAANTVISDISQKENIRLIPYGLETILDLNPVVFDFKPGCASEAKNNLGFIAQEVEPIIPELVTVWGEDSHKGLKTGDLIPVLVKAIQELSAEIETLKQRIK